MRKHISGTTRPNVTKVSTHVACGRGSTLFCGLAVCRSRHVVNTNSQEQVCVEPRTSALNTTLPAATAGAPAAVDR